MNKYDYSLLFRGSAIFALSSIVKSKAVGQGSNDVHDTLQLSTHVCDITEGHLLAAVGSNVFDCSVPFDFDFLLVCLQRLINVTVAIVMEIDPSSPLMFRLFDLWSTIRLLSNHISVQRECIEFVVVASMFPSEAMNGDLACRFLQQVMHTCSIFNSIHFFVFFRPCLGEPTLILNLFKPL